MESLLTALLATFIQFGAKSYVMIGAKSYPLLSRCFHMSNIAVVIINDAKIGQLYLKHKYLANFFQEK